MYLRIAVIDAYQHCGLDACNPHNLGHEDSKIVILSIAAEAKQTPDKFHLKHGPWTVADLWTVSNLFMIR